MYVVSQRPTNLYKCLDILKEVFFNAHIKWTEDMVIFSCVEGRETKKCFKIYVHLVWPSVISQQQEVYRLTHQFWEKKVPTKCFKFSSKNVCSASLKASISWILMTISDKKKNFVEGGKNKNIFFPPRNKKKNSCNCHV